MIARVKSFRSSRRFSGANVVPKRDPALVSARYLVAKWSQDDVEKAYLRYRMSESDEDRHRLTGFRTMNLWLRDEPDEAFAAGADAYYTNFAMKREELVERLMRERAPVDSVRT